MATECLDPVDEADQSGPTRCRGSADAVVADHETQPGAVIANAARHVPAQRLPAPSFLTTPNARVRRKNIRIFAAAARSAGRIEPAPTSCTRIRRLATLVPIRMLSTLV
jgi:hypothetical protein